MSSNKLQLPIGWKECKLSNICSIIGDGLHGTPKYNDDGEYYFINGNNLINGKIVFKNDSKKVDEAEYNKYKKILNDTTIFLSINGTIGSTALYNDEKVVLGKSVCYLNINSNNDRKFFKYLLDGTKFQNYIHNYSTGTTIKNVSLKLIREYDCVIPPLEEQKRISEIFSLCDDVIENLNNLIEKKDQYKKGVMQRVLSGKVRFNGFTDEWKEIKISDLVEKNIIFIEKGKNINKNKILSGDIPVIAGGKIPAYYHSEYTHDFPCITISASGAYSGYVWLHNDKIWASDCNVLYTENKKYNIKFLFYYLTYIQELIYYMQTGGAQPHIYAKDIITLKVPCISIKEQEKISGFLSVIDDEIENLKKQLELRKEQKKGIMQMLLTGEIRI
ncbi:restriction endonuclease subunit S [Brachyspira hampsonii]|uniref:restriction endonuclease subunit S n=1 Tax=Brachyspira hampsonii TaxID=1287055 RepID=UPI001CA48B99|nr:restriction endonuclease subunit S [Brachyspira hampsonii]MBW5389133.1 restriction endonuclease subunit S [Brachyspira hampsonii]